MAIKRCKSSFAASVRGVPRVMKTGQLVNDNDPIIKGREHLFEDVESAVRDVPVEDASAAPGRRRTLTRAAGRAAKKTAPAKKTAAKTEPKTDSTSPDTGTGAGGGQEGAAP
ncbi:hypothetical protein [Streptomyces sp. NPDC055058]